MSTITPQKRTVLFAQKHRRHSLRSGILNIALAVTAFSFAASAGNKYWDISGATAGAGGTTPSGAWDTTTANWSTDSTGASAATTWASGDTAILSAGTDATGAYTLTVGTPLTLAGITREEGSPTISAVAANVMTFSGGALAVDTGTGTLILNAFYAPSTGVITKIGSGVFSPGTSQSTFAGKWIVNAGSLSFAGDTRIGVVPGSLVADQITLNGTTARLRSSTASAVFTANRGITLGANGGGFDHVGTVTLTWAGPITGTSGGALTMSGAGILILSSTANNYDGSTIPTAGTIQLGAAGVIPDTSVIAFNGGKLDLNGFNETVKSLSGTVAGWNLTVGTGTLTIANPAGEQLGNNNGTINGTGKIVKNGSGSLLLNINTGTGFTGEFDLNAGALGISSNPSMGVGTLVINNSPKLSAGGTAGRAPSVTGVTLSGDLTSDDTFNATPGTITWAATTPFTITGGNRTYTVNTAANNGYIVTINGVIGQDTAGRSLTKAGNGVLKLGAVNTYTGGSSVTAGTLEVTSAGSIKGNVSVSNGATFKPDATSSMESTASLTLGGTATGNLSYTGTMNISTLTIGGTQKTAGTWGAIGSSATHQTSALTGTGILNVSSGPATSTSVSLTSGSNPSTYGDSLTFTATVTGNSPTGAIQWVVDGSNSGSPVTLSGGSAALVVSSLNVAGSPHSVSAIYSGDDNNNTSSSSSVSQSVNARVVTLTGTRVYDATATADAAILSIANKVGADDVSVASGSASVASGNVGSQAIASLGSLALGGAAAGNYTLSGASGSISITAAALSITANDITKHKGNTYNFNGSEFTSSGLVSPETIGSVTLTSAGADSGADAGTYPIVPSAATGGTFTAGNYSITYHNGTMTVDAPATVTSSPSSSAVDAGTTVVLSVTATGTPTPTYQWKKGASNLSNGAFDNAATASGATTANLTLTSVRAADAGNYTCVVNNSAGSDTSLAATLTVNDPAITAQPTNSTFECGTSNALTVTAVGTTNVDGVLTYQWYTPDPNGTAITDATNAFLSFPAASFANAGSYSVVVSNALGNSITSLVAVVTVHDSVAPVITVNAGDATAECHTSYADAGASAVDACDGTVSVTTNGLPNVNVPDTYTITYTATDASNNTSTATRVVVVGDHTAPNVSLIGSDPLIVECHSAFIDPGATVTDTCDAGAACITNGIVNTNTPGNYIVTYSSTDAGGNTASITRTVNVIDSLPPVVSLTGSTDMTVECHSAFIEPGVSANDACEGPIPDVTITGTVLTNSVGDYTLTYTACDSGNRCSSVTRVVHIHDGTAPHLSITGDNPMTVECHGSFSDPGATATDDCDASPNVVTTNTVNPDVVGAYTLTYTATDAVGNSASDTRVVNVIDGTPPVITVTSGDQTVECHTLFTDPGATALDACEGNVSTNIIITGGPVETNTPGLYTLTYTVSDSSSNHISATRTVTVQDTVGPVITMNGPNPDTACLLQPQPYNDPGVSANDACSGDIVPNVSGHVDTTIAGTYTLTYSVTDGHSNTTMTNRVVVVAPCGVTIIDPPHDVTVDANSPFTLSVSATANVPLSYQWKKGATIIAGANGSAYTVDHAFRANAGSYSVDVIGTTTTNVGPAVVTVNDPAIVTSPASYTINLPVETKHAFSVAAAGTGTLKYQWYLGTSKIFGQTASSYTVTGITVAFNGRQYSCSVSNVGAAHAAVSAPATLTVYQVPKVVAAVPTAQPKFIGQIAYLKVTAAPATALAPATGGPVYYQWVSGSSTVLSDGLSGNGSTYSGTKSSMLTIQNLQLGDTGSYRCLMTNATAVNVFSLPATVTVKDYTNAPVVVIMKPVQNAKTNDPNVMVSGTVTDKGLVTNVWLTQTTNQVTITNEGLTFVYKTNALHQQLTGNVLWTNFVTLAPGTNTFFAYAQNDKGTNGVSGKTPRTVFFLQQTSLNVIPTGPGTVLPTKLGVYGNPTNSGVTTNVYVNIGYTVTAHRNTSHVTFQGWFDANDVAYPSSPANTNLVLHFTIPDTTGLTLKAKFQ